MEPDALEQCYRRYRRELYLYLLTLTGNPALAEDLLQETFLKALLSLPETHGNIRAWLYQVARHLYFDVQRREKHLDRDRDGAEPAEKRTPEPLEKLLADEKRRALYRGLSRLEPRKREVLELQYFGGLSQKEIASILHLRPDHIRVLALRARREVRAWMEENGYDIS